jgi:hypothetical protein
MEDKKLEIQVQVSEEALKGIYANHAVISHTRGEFYLDFMTIFPPKGVVGARVFASPNFAKSLMKALQDNILQYEKKFGTIEEAKPPEAYQ